MHAKRKPPEGGDQTHMGTLPGILRRIAAHGWDEGTLRSAQRNHRAKPRYSKRVSQDETYPDEGEREDGHEGGHDLYLHEHQETCEAAVSK